MNDARPALDPADWTTHVAFVRRLARSLVADRADADDLEQEAWLAWRRSPPRDEGAARGWLARVVSNLARMGMRSRTRREARERTVAAGATRHAAAVDESVAQIELHRRVVERVLALDQSHRAVLVLRFFEQRSLGEIAQLLSLPLETVKTRQKRALQRLRDELLGGEGGGRDARRRALVMLAQGTGALVMTSSTKWAVGTAAAVVIACVAARPWLWPDAATPPLRVAAADAPAAAVAEEAPLAPPVAAVRDASPPPEDAAPAAPVPTVRRAAIESRIHGDVHDAAGRPLPGRRVELYERQRNRYGRDQTLVASTLADAEGRFRFDPTPFERGAAATVIAWDGSASVGKAIVPSQGSAVHLVIGATKSLIGRVVDLRGNAVADATLFAGMRFREGRHDDGYFVPESLAPLATTRSAADGAFAFDELPCRWNVTVEVTREGFASYRESFHLDDSPSDHEATIVLRPECRIEGIVTLADGTPAAGIQIGAQLQDGDAFRERNNWGEGATDPQGRYRIDGLEAGNWNVLVTLGAELQEKWCAAPSQQVRLTADAPLARADFLLPLGGELVVRVTDSGRHEPVVDLWIGVQSAARSQSGAAIQSITTDDAGVARLRLPAGPFSAYLGPDVLAPTWGRREGTIVEGETLEWTLEVGRGTTLLGKVLQPDGGPAADAVVWTKVPRRRVGDPVKTVAQTDGSFELASLPPQEKWELFAATADAALREPFVVDPAGDLDRLELRLVARPRTRLSGTVVGQDGQPIAGVELQATERLSDNSLFGDLDSPDPALRVLTDANGGFEFRGLWCDARYHVSAVFLQRGDGDVKALVARLEVAALHPGEERELDDVVLRPQDEGR